MTTPGSTRKLSRPFSIGYASVGRPRTPDEVPQNPDGAQIADDNDISRVARGVSGIPGHALGIPKRLVYGLSDG